MSTSLVTPIESNGTETVTAASRYPKEIAKRVAADFAETAIERDRQGGTAQRERNLLRQSGLLNLLIPEQFGGGGSEWPEILAIVRTFARVDGSLAHLFGFQHLLLATIDLFGSDEQRDFYF
jgi:alkylation response protein AidB-like acyl-CoA dehydrogenase